MRNENMILLFVLSVEFVRAGRDAYESIDIAHEHMQTQFRSIMQMRLHIPDLLDYSVRKFLFNFEHIQGSVSFHMQFKTNSTHHHCNRSNDPRAIQSIQFQYFHQIESKML